jgi:hypothetical protein
LEARSLLAGRRRRRGTGPRIAQRLALAFIHGVALSSVFALQENITPFNWAEKQNERSCQRADLRQYGQDAIPVDALPQVNPFAKGAMRSQAGKAGGVKQTAMARQGAILARATVARDTVARATVARAN